MDKSCIIFVSFLFILGMSKEFKEIRQRIIKQLSELFPSIVVDLLGVKKSPPVQSLYKVILCPPLPPKLFKQALESIVSNSAQQSVLSPHENITKLQQTLKQAQQYFTACINILEHNEKVRQRYEVISINEQNSMDRQSKQVSELIRVCQRVRSKGELRKLVEERGEKVMEVDAKGISIGKQEQHALNKRTSSKNITKAQQPGQLYLPAHPDQFSFITRISYNQYLISHEQVLQKLLIQLTTLSNINQQLSITHHNYNYNLQPIKQLLKSLTIDEMFCQQDNKFNKLVRFVLEYVHEVVQNKESKKNSIQSKRRQLRQSFLRVYYLQFMVRNELQIICIHIKSIIDINEDALLHLNQPQSPKQELNMKTITTQIQQMSQIKQSIFQIFQYLTYNQQTIFTLLYKRKVKKFFLKYQQTEKLIMLTNKINKSIIELRMADDILPRQSSQNGQQAIRGSVSQSIKMKSNNSNNVNQNNAILLQLQNLTTRISNIQQEINSSFPKVSNSFQTLSPQHTMNYFEQFISSFKKLYRHLQKCQLKLSQLEQMVSKQILPLKEMDSNKKSTEQQIQSLKTNILAAEQILIDRFKTLIHLNNHTNLPLSNYLLNNKNSNIFTMDDDKQSVISGVSSSSLSSKSSIFQPYQIQQSDVILSKPTIINQSYIPPPLNLQQLIKTTSDFITNQLLKNQLLTEQLEDAKNVNFQMLNCLIYHVGKNVNDIIRQSATKTNQPQSPPKQKPPLNRSQSPQKNKPKGKVSRDKQLKRSPKKGPPQKQKNSPTKQQQSLTKQQNNKYQTLQNLKDKLIFIRQILCPQISQCRISKIFQQTLHTEIFQKICSIITAYKQKLFTQKVYLDADKYGLRSFLQERVSFIDTVLKNQKQLLQIFNFIKIFSQQKVKFQLIDERTFEIILRALLASKQVQAYRRENLDLAKLRKLSSHGVRMLDEEVYVPFMTMFKSLLKIVSSEDSTVKGLQQMLQSIKLALQIKDSINQLFSIEQQDNNIIKQIQTLISSISTIQRFGIFKYRKLQLIQKILRSSLSIETKSSSNQERKGYILKYLQNKLLQRQNDETREPLLS